MEFMMAVKKEGWKGRRERREGKKEEKEWKEEWMEGRKEGRKEGRNKGSIKSGPIIAIMSQFLAGTFQKLLTQFMYKIELFYLKSSFYNIFYYV